MARSFKGKLVADFLRLKSTKDYILVLESRYGDSHNGPQREALRVVQGGTPELPGTWMDETAAALSRQKNIATGSAHDERYGKVRTYHEDILTEVIQQQ